MASTGRYISPQDFGVLIADLRLAQLARQHLDRVTDRSALP